eukprot:jgi/Botrbrau1/15246/Bobra.0149s0096.1
MSDKLVTEGTGLSIEDDDDFEEFEIEGQLPSLVLLEDWGSQQEDVKNPGLWERDWDDDLLNDSFAVELKRQLAPQQ